MGQVLVEPNRHAPGGRPVILAAGGRSPLHDLPPRRTSKATQDRHSARPPCRVRNRIFDPQSAHGSQTSPGASIRAPSARELGAVATPAADIYNPSDAKKSPPVALLSVAASSPALWVKGAEGSSASSGVSARTIAAISPSVSFAARVSER